MSFPNFVNLTSILLIERKGIPRATFILMSANKQVSSKNQIFPMLYWSKNTVKAISQVSRDKLSIFYASTPVFRGVRPSFFT